MLNKYATIKWIKKGKQIIKKIIMGERRASYGSDYPDKTFYVIRSASQTIGLYAYVLTFSGRIKEAIDRKYIPIIDMQNNKNPYLDEKDVGKKNAVLRESWVELREKNGANARKSEKSREN